MSRILVFIQTLLVIVAMLISAQPNPIPVELCRPSYGLNIRQCNNRRLACLRDWGIVLEWTGMGSRDKNGRPLGDGGCQCSGYCGYLSRKPCNRDNDCFWNTNLTQTAEPACFFKNGVKGAPKPVCV